MGLRRRATAFADVRRIIFAEEEDAGKYRDHGRRADGADRRLAGYDRVTATVRDATRHREFCPWGRA